MATNQVTHEMVRTALDRAAARRSVPDSESVAACRRVVRARMVRVALRQGWITPAGEFVPTGAHEEWLLANAGRFGLDLTAAPTEPTALKVWGITQGFVRVNFESRSGTLNYEAAADRFSRAAKDALVELVAEHAPEIWHIRAALFNDLGQLVRRGETPVFEHDDGEKVDHIPLVTAARRPARPASARMERRALGKAWITPDGDLVAHGSHDRWLLENPARLRALGLDPAAMPRDEQGSRLWALGHGFVRLNYLERGGLLVVEADRRHFGRQTKDMIAAMVIEYASDLYGIRVNLLDGNRVAGSAEASWVGMDDADKVNHIPFVTE